MANLDIDNVGKKYGSTEVLRDIGISIETGEFLVLLGPSGCGKSTLLSLIAGLEDITNGEIRIGGNRVNDLKPKDRDIAMVFQSYALYPTMTVKGNISFGLEIRNTPKVEREASIQKVAELLQIDHLLNRKPSQLSGGQRQRVAMGRALVRNPKLFLFDEPLSNLDAKLRVEMRSEIKRLHKKTETTIVYVTHDQIEAMTMATRIVILNGGDIQQQGTPDEIYNNPANAFVAAFMGSPPMNLIKAKAVLDQGKWTIHIKHNDEIIILPYPSKLSDACNGKLIHLGIRPEHIVEEIPRQIHEDEFFQYKCTINLVEPTGADTFAMISLGGKESICKLKPETKVDLGDKIELNFAIQKICIFDIETGERLDNYSLEKQKEAA